MGATVITAYLLHWCRQRKELPWGQATRHPPPPCSPRVSQLPSYNLDPRLLPTTQTVDAVSRKPPGATDLVVCCVCACVWLHLCCTCMALWQIRRPLQVICVRQHRRVTAFICFNSYNQQNLYYFSGLRLHSWQVCTWPISSQDASTTHKIIS